MIGAGKSRDTTVGKYPGGLSESWDAYKLRVRVGQCLGLDPCGGCMDGSEAVQISALVVAVGLSQFVVHH